MNSNVDNSISAVKVHYHHFLEQNEIGWLHEVDFLLIGTASKNGVDDDEGIEKIITIDVNYMPYV